MKGDSLHPLLVETTSNARFVPGYQAMPLASGWIPWLLLLPLMAFLIGCGGDKTPKRSSVDHSLFQEEFQNAPAPAKSALEEASQAVKQKDFVSAFQSMKKAVEAMDVNQEQYDALYEASSQMQQVMYSFPDKNTRKADKALSAFMSALDPKFKKAQTRFQKQEEQGQGQSRY